MRSRFERAETHHSTRYYPRYTAAELGAVVRQGTPAAAAIAHDHHLFTQAQAQQTDD
jgi:hypothetical protein